MQIYRCDTVSSFNFVKNCTELDYLYASKHIKTLLYLRDSFMKHDVESILYVEKKIMLHYFCT